MCTLKSPFRLPFLFRLLFHNNIFIFLSNTGNQSVLGFLTLQDFKNVARLWQLAPCPDFDILLCDLLRAKCAAPRPIAYFGFVSSGSAHRKDESLIIPPLALPLSSSSSSPLSFSSSELPTSVSDYSNACSGDVLQLCLSHATPQRVAIAALLVSASADHRAAFAEFCDRCVCVCVCVCV